MPRLRHLNEHNLGGGFDAARNSKRLVKRPAFAAGDETTLHEGMMKRLEALSKAAFTRPKQAENA